MATLAERISARKTTLGESPSHERQYIVTDATDKEDATTTLLSGVPTTVDVATISDPASLVSIPRSGANVEEMEGDDSVYFCVVNWGQTRRGSINLVAPASPLLVQVATEFSTGGGTRHITHGITETKFLGTGVSSAPDMRKAINVIDGEIQGIDILVPQPRWTESYEKAASEMTQAFVNKLLYLTGKVNQLGWRGLGAREVLLVNVRGQKDGSNKWKIDFEFAYSPNLTNAKFGNDDVTGIVKPGHDYLWALPKKKADTFSWAHTVYAAYVNQVYEEADFYDLGLGA